MFDNAPKCSVRASRIHGRGLFTDCFIAAGDVVVDYANDGLWARRRYTDLSMNEILYCRFIGVDENWCEVPQQEHKFFCANHSRQPNLLWHPARRVLTALVDLSPDTELTYDYRLDTTPSWWPRMTWA